MKRASRVLGIAWTVSLSYAFQVKAGSDKMDAVEKLAKFDSMLYMNDASDELSGV